MALTEGSVGRAFAAPIGTGDQGQTGFYPSILHGIPVLDEPIIGHLRCSFTDVPPQPNSQPGAVSCIDRREPSRMTQSNGPLQQPPRPLQALNGPG